MDTYCPTDRSDKENAVAYKKRQAGFALLMVMLVVAMAVVVGLSYVSSASVKMVSSDNLLKASRAKYLAESGLQHALHVLTLDPDSLKNSERRPKGEFYADQTGDGYSFYAVEDEHDPGRYVITARAKTGGVTQTASMVVRRDSGKAAILDKGVMVGRGSAQFPPGVRINGGLHVNGSLYNLARITGDVSATGWISDPWRRIDGAVDDRAEREDVPKISWSTYKKYNLSGVSYQAEKRETKRFQADDPLNDGGAITDGNCGGVVWLKPQKGKTVTLGDNVHFRGTLIINNDLVLDGRNIELTPVDGFPAIVVNGYVLITRDTQAELNGLVVSTKGFLPQGLTESSRTEINGGLLCDRRGYSLQLGGNHVMNFVPEKCRLYDFGNGQEEAASISVLSWED